ncbi:tRNA pseudouridine(38-40) synthase TruA, partial [Myxococcota bacterium]|nr:tRNA pseudouridine(38-40) synthase TruA [Myxococcota bacterium]
VLEKALRIFEKRFVRVKGASRTDAGVHARGQRVFFITPCNIPDRGYLRGLNAQLPEDIAVTAVHRVPVEFNARLTQGKVYEYVIRHNRIPDPLNSRYHYHCFKPLSADLMRQGAAHFLGTHDFTSFQAADCGRPDAIRTIHSVEIIEEDGIYRIRVFGTAFLRNMVRIMAGTLYEVGRGVCPPEAVAEIIEAKDRRLAGPTLPAKGLTLLQIHYDDY